MKSAPFKTFYLLLILPPTTESVFAPSADMDLDNGEIDDDERELEAFKRFCFNSVPAKQKAKISLDVNTLKRK